MESLLAAIGSDSSNAIDPEKEFNYGFKTITDIMAEDPNSHYWQTATPERKRKALERASTRIYSPDGDGLARAAQAELKRIKRESGEITAHDKENMPPRYQNHGGERRVRKSLSHQHFCPLDDEAWSQMEHADINEIRAKRSLPTPPQATSRKKGRCDSRFHSSSTQDEQEMKDKVAPKRTNANRQWGASVFKDWMIGEASTPMSKSWARKRLRIMLTFSEGGT